MNGSVTGSGKVFLDPGEVYIAETPCIVTTVLGSCVAVTMFHRKTCLGAISHSLLPSCGKIEHCGQPCRSRYKYVECSILSMLEAFRKAGISHREIEVRLFGGADMYEATIANTASVGKQNAAVALRILQEQRLRVTVIDTGGTTGRRLHFDTHTGEIQLQSLGEQGHESDRKKNKGTDRR